MELSADYAARRVPVEIRAAWFHHRFAEIHPYPDGNGRTARALASLLLIQGGRFPLIIRASEKAIYFDALEKADGRDFRPLVERFRALQRRQVVKMSAAAAFAHRGGNGEQSLDQVMEIIRAKLDGLYPEESVQSEALETAVAAFGEIVTGRFERLIGQLNVGRATPNRRLNCSRIVIHPSDIAWLQTAPLDYEPRFTSTSRTFALRQNAVPSWEIVCSFHEPGEAKNRLAAAVVFLTPPSETARPAFEPFAEYFLITGAEPLSQLQSRFANGFEGQLLRSLLLWQEQL